LSSDLGGSLPNSPKSWNVDFDAEEKGQKLTAARRAYLKGEKSTRGLTQKAGELA